MHQKEMYTYRTSATGIKKSRIWSIIVTIYRQTSNTIRALWGNKCVDYSDVVGGTISSFWAKHMASVHWAKTYKMIRETFNFWDLVPLVLEVWWYLPCVQPENDTLSVISRNVTQMNHILYLLTWIELYIFMPCTQLFTLFVLSYALVWLGIFECCSSGSGLRHKITISPCKRRNFEEFVKKRKPCAYFMEPWQNGWH